MGDISRQSCHPDEGRDQRLRIAEAISSIRLLFLMSRFTNAALCFQKGVGPRCKRAPKWCIGFLDTEYKIIEVDCTIFVALYQEFFGLYYIFG